MSEVSAASQTGIWLMFSPTIFSASAKNIYIYIKSYALLYWLILYFPNDRQVNDTSSPVVIQ